MKSVYKRLLSSDRYIVNGADGDGNVTLKLVYSSGNWWSQKDKKVNYLLFFLIYHLVKGEVYFNKRIVPKEECVFEKKKKRRRKTRKRS